MGGLSPLKGYHKPLSSCVLLGFLFNSFLVPHITFPPREKRHVAGAQAVQPTFSEGIQTTVMSPSFLGVFSRVCLSCVFLVIALRVWS